VAPSVEAVDAFAPNAFDDDRLAEQRALGRDDLRHATDRLEGEGVPI
jgi:hypothetical protein